MTMDYNEWRDSLLAPGNQGAHSAQLKREEHFENTVAFIAKQAARLLMREGKTGRTLLLAVFEQPPEELPLTWPSGWPEAIVSKQPISFTPPVPNTLQHLKR